MTRQRNDNHSTEFGLWLRNYLPDNETIIRSPDPLDSSKGFITTNIDYIWSNYKNGKWIHIEEKRHGKWPKGWQYKIFERSHRLALIDPLYFGYHIIVFENTNPEDGDIYIKSLSKEILDFDLAWIVKISKDELMNLLYAFKIIKPRTAEDTKKYFEKIKNENS